MTGQRWLLGALASILLAGIAGCGGSVAGSSSTGNAVAKSQGCIDASCHGSIASQVTGRSIVEEWKSSSHYFKNMAGCTTCHEHSHQNQCASCHGGAVPQSSAQLALKAAAKCKECHLDGPNLISGIDNRHLPELNANFGETSTYSVTTGWNNSTNPPTAANTTGGWVTMRGTQFESQCISCHNPHDSRILTQHQQWAESGHGDPAAAYIRADQKIRGSFGDYRTEVVGDSCVRCHTATGFVNWVISGFKDVKPFGKNTAFANSTTAKTKETLYCIVCHDNGSGKAYGYNLRQIPAQGAGGGQRVFYNYSGAQGTLINAGANANNDASGEVFSRHRVVNNFIDYPNIGISDRCLICHTGRGGGQLIKLAASTTGLDGKPFNFRRNGRISTHDFAGAGTMFKTLGFEFYSSFRYAQPNGIPYRHDQIGQANFANTGTNGPCVTCHMSGTESHSYMPVSFTDASHTTVSSINTIVCNTCHGAGGIGNPFFRGTVTDLNTHKTGYAAAIKSLNAWLQVKVISSTSNWLRTETFASTITTAGGPQQNACVPPADRSLDVLLGSRNMGAAMNFDYMSNDPGGFVHNDLYVKRLIYDSVDWLDDCTMNNSAETAIGFTSNAIFNLGAGRDFRLSAADITNAVNYLGGTGSGRPGGN